MPDKNNSEEVLKWPLDSFLYHLASIVIHCIFV